MAYSENPEASTMIKKTVAITEPDLQVDLTLHNVPASLIAEFAEKIAKPYYNGNMNAAVQDLLHKTLAEQNFVHAHITHLKSRET